MAEHLYTDKIKEWRSIITLVVFISINIPMLISFRLPVYIPAPVLKGIRHTCTKLRLISSVHWPEDWIASRTSGSFVRFGLPINYTTAPGTATLFLIAISAIGTHEIQAGIIGNEETQISPYDVILVFLTIGYVGNSLAASGLVTYQVSKLLQRYKNRGHKLYFFLYICFFGLGAFIGNDPIMVVFLAYLTTASTNVMHPRAYIFTQFVIANVATGLLASSNPTNLVLAGTFNIKFVDYTANMALPTIATAVLLFPLLLYIVFQDECLLPGTLHLAESPSQTHAYWSMHYGQAFADSMAYEPETERSRQIDAVLNPLVHRKSIIFGIVIMLATVIILLALNAAYLSKGGSTDYWVTLPAAFLVLSWDIYTGWARRSKSPRTSMEEKVRTVALRDDRNHQISQQLPSTGLSSRNRMYPTKDEDLTSCSSDEPQLTYGVPEPTRKAVPIFIAPLATDKTPQTNCPTPSADVEMPTSDLEAKHQGLMGQVPLAETRTRGDLKKSEAIGGDASQKKTVGLINGQNKKDGYQTNASQKENADLYPSNTSRLDDGAEDLITPCESPPRTQSISTDDGNVIVKNAGASDSGMLRFPDDCSICREQTQPRAALQRVLSNLGLDDSLLASRPATTEMTLLSCLQERHEYFQQTFPTATICLSSLPYYIIPFSFFMFILVEALVSNGWVPAFAYMWDLWAMRTGPVGCICGMGFLGVVLSNFAGTNIGACILLSRVVEAWQDIHDKNAVPISDRMFWGTVYSLSLGVNYGAFSWTFYASLTGMMWREALGRQHIRVGGLEFARVTLPIVSTAMVIACSVLVGQVYILRDETPYNLN